MPTIIYAQRLAGADPEFVNPHVHYGPQRAQIRLQVGDPGFHGERPKVDGYKTDLHELLDALEDWEKSQMPIAWLPTGR